jgi:hypothetical protein
MTKKLKYLKTRVMEPREGVKYSTTYYQQNSEQAQEAFKHIKHVAESIVDVCERDLDMREFVQSPLAGFSKTTNKPNYSMEDVVTDLLNQLDNGKDIPSGMIGRWNRLFKETPWDIELEEYISTKEIRTGLFNNMFEIK